MQLKFWHIGFNFLLSFGWDMNVQSQISVLRIVQNVQKWLIIVSKESNARNVTQFLLGVDLFLVFLAIRKS